MSSSSATRTPEVAVVGGGPAGLVSAIALTAAGVETLLIAPSAADDHRTTALLAGSVTALATLGVWDACVPHAAPLASIRIIDNTRRLLRAPEVMFASAEIGLDAEQDGTNRVIEADSAAEEKAVGVEDARRVLALDPLAAA